MTNGPAPSAPSRSAAAPSRSQPSSFSSTASTTAPAGASTSLELADLNATGGLESGKTFSPPVIIAMVVTFLLGLAVMFAMMSSVNANALVAMQEEDAKNLAAAVKPKIQSFQEAADKIAKLDPGTPNPELASEIAAADFVVPGSVLSNVRVPLPAGLTDSVTGYAADSTMLKALLDEHVRVTTKADKEELDEILKGNEAVQNNRAFAVIYDYQDVMKNAGAEDYQPKRGTLVGIREFKEESKKYEIEFLGTGRLGEIEPQKLIPIDTTQILKSGGQNALSRYQQRVREIKFHAAKMANYTPHLLTSLETAASGEMAAAAEAAPAEAAPVAAEPAE